VAVLLCMQVVGLLRKQSVEVLLFVRFFWLLQVEVDWQLEVFFGVDRLLLSVSI
jgi:hypothetical protein